MQLLEESQRHLYEVKKLGTKGYTMYIGHSGKGKTIGTKISHQGLDVAEDRITTKMV